MIAVNDGVGKAVDRVQSIVIVGGGAAGWLAAASLGRLLSRSFYRILVIDSPLYASGAVSEAVLPSFHRLNHLLGINEQDLLKKTRGTYRLGARFADWGAVGGRYLHAFGSFGAKLEAVPFHHYWIKLHRMGEGLAFEDYSTAAAAAKQCRFAPPVSDRQSVLSTYSYGYHFHAASLAAYLKEYALAHGVLHSDRSIAEVQLRGEDGFIDALLTDDGARICADLYLDCTGALGILAQQALKTGFEDWSRWLTCDRFVGISSASAGDAPPYSDSLAERCGWRRRVPLQDCADVGLAYSSRHVSDDEAAAKLLAGLAGAALGEPKLLSLPQGRPTRFWNKNCIALTGSSAEPLEHTGLHLVQTGVMRLIALFPVGRFSAADMEEYNRLTAMEHERIRDFLILHYKCTQRSDSPFWEYCRNMQVPDTLRRKLELFRSCGRVALLDEEHFTEDSWLAVLLGQNIHPMDYDPLADVLDVGAVKDALSHMRSLISEGVASLPLHARYLERHCAVTPRTASE
ncbi:MAG: tryptophan halogenase family protein [Gammaproteobacteria bacterium]